MLAAQGSKAAKQQGSRAAGQQGSRAFVPCPPSVGALHDNEIIS